MKRKITLIIIILFTIATKAQSYFPLRNVETNLESFSGVNGQWIAISPANNTLGANYYQGINFGFDINNYTSLVNGVGTNDLYFGRWSGGWKGWNKIWHSGNLNNTDTDFTAKTINITAGLDIKNSYNANTTKALKMFYQGSWGTPQYASDYRFIDVESTEGGKILALNGCGMGIGFNPPSYSSKDKLYINGNVGIGTNNPEKKLQVDASSADAGLRIHASVGDNNTNTPYLLLTGGYLPNNGVALRGVNDELYGKKALVFYSGWEGNTDNPEIDALQERIRVSSNGNVGIGTMSPDSKLTVAGNIHSREVKVTVDAGADFVFENDYNLPSLESVNKFIKENKHLPEIASADEMKKDGINLSEMNIKLLQKIEEMTLYMIEMKKEIELLKNK